MRRAAVLLVVLGTLGAACSSDGDSLSPTSSTVTTLATTGTDGPAVETTEQSPNEPTPTVSIDPGPTDPTAPVSSTPLEDATDITVSVGFEQVLVSGAEPGTDFELHGPTGDPLQSGVADANGMVLFRQVDGEPSDTVYISDGTHISAEYPLLWNNGTPPDQSFYAEQRLPTGDANQRLGYVTTRDGTTLSASVWLPGPLEDGPYPTVVEYSGYSPSNPNSTGFPDLITALGYAYVGVNVRGTGCSGGSFRYFEYAQSLDGYDVIEAVAAQPWVLDNEVGMVGISYPGISQLFVAQTQPPSLTAITPLSVLDDSYAATLYPGGILNTGFALAWTEERQREAQPEGQQWASDQIDGGDEVCESNQLLRLQNPDLAGQIFDEPFWLDDEYGEIAPRLFVDQIEVPTFVAGAWQDEQTGGRFATMLDQFTGTEHMYASLVNGLHTESIGPAVFPRLVEFLDLYVGKRVPSLAAARVVAPILGGSIYGTSDLTLPAADRFAGMTYDEALAAFETEPPIVVLFEEGAAEGTAPRTPQPRFEATFSSWPVPEAVATTWFLTDATAGVAGTLGIEPGAADAEPAEYLALPDAIPPTFYEGDGNGVWSVDVEYDWVEGGAGTFASWATEPLTATTTVVGTGSVDLWVTSNLGDTDLEATISEIRPDGSEVYVQSGWLRASMRTLDEAASTDLRPVHTYSEDDAELLPTGESDGAFALARIELFPFAHVFRAGSRIRLSVDAPGGNRAIWEFDTIAGGERVTVSQDAAFPSALVLPVVDLAASGVDVPASYPTCDALRGQPCRPFAG
ncbi:MAG TPA: CocE/NonD family hydrolase [Ilumatobacter sp.]|nr:CocE/NonD family hydrolase [Ilumatobacter sp.]